MQSKTQQQKILTTNASRLDTFCWFVAIYRGGKEETILLANGNIPIVPVILWPSLSFYADQAELSRVLAEQMAKSIRRHNPTTADLVPSLIAYADLAKQGLGWEEWQAEEIEIDNVCPHCGEVNAAHCCADWQPKRKPRRKQR